MKTRLKILFNAIINYITILRVFLLVVLALGLFLVAADSIWIRIAGVALATSAPTVLLAQQNSRSSTTQVLQLPISSQEVIDAGDLSLPATEFGDPLVSVIIPGRNEAAFVADCIASLKRQSLARFEAIIVDDASTDATLDALMSAIGDDGRFHVISLRTAVGPGRARNLAVSRARAGTLTFLDLDDFLAPSALESRFQLLAKHADRPWVAGAYSWHEALPAGARFDQWQPPGTKTKSATISWIQRPDDNVFVVSAPLVRRDAFEAVGGFDDAIGEDPKLWFTMLRAGFTFVGTGKVEIGYRQKPRSRAQSTYREMGSDVAELIRLGEAAAPKPAGVVGPYWYAEAMADLRYARARANRLAASLGFAVANGDRQTAEDVIAELAQLPYPLTAGGWIMSIAGHARHTLLRVAKAANSTSDTTVVSPELGLWEREVEQLLDALVTASNQKGGEWLKASKSLSRDHEIETVEVEPKVRIAVNERSLPAVLEGGRPFLLLPSAAYHTDELIGLVPELRARGLDPIAMINDVRWKTTENAMARVDVPVVDALPAGPWLHDFAGLLTFNDWGEYYSEYVRYLADSPVPTFAKVEGVQDWHDRDTGRTRNAYMSADVVLCQGDNDVRALKDRRDGLEVVGSDRLERIWRDALPPDGSPSIVANVNFTYGVLTEHRDLWVETVVAAAKAAGLPLSLSMHPSETATYPDIASDDPLRHLLTTSSIFVSRFSTAIFEAMARGCSSIYYNPHGEEVETFQEPGGAFFVARNPRELSDCLRYAAGETRQEVRAKAAEFFMNQVSIIPGEPPTKRAAMVIAGRIGA